MTTTAKLAANLPDATPLHRLADEDFHAQADGENGAIRYAVVVLRPSGFGANATSDNGVKQHTKYTVDKLEVLDPEAGRKIIDDAVEARGGKVDELPLEYDDPAEKEQGALILEALLDAHERNGIDLTQAWYGFYDPKQIAEPSKARLLHLKDFADHERVPYEIVAGGPLDEAEPADGMDEAGTGTDALAVTLTDDEPSLED